jgi:AraC-like DNA-binding protein
MDYPESRAWLGLDIEGPLTLLDPTEEREEETANGISSDSVAVTLFGHTVPHQHRRAQLLYVVSGAIMVKAEGKVWTVPPRCAFWLPGGVLHSGGSAGHVQVTKLYLEPELAEALSPECGILMVRPLLRELIMHFGEQRLFPPDRDGREARLIDVLVDELRNAPVESLHLPMPCDQRLQKLTMEQLSNPALSLTIEQWGIHIGMSARTLSRLFQRETGLSFFKWRQRMHIGLAMQRLAKDELVSNIALDLGYESASAFIAMFRKITGTTPARYFSKRQFN